MSISVSRIEHTPQKKRPSEHGPILTEILLTKGKCWGRGISVYTPMALVDRSRVVISVVKFRVIRKSPVGSNLRAGYANGVLCSRWVNRTTLHG